jgi:hypothetical protein
MGSDGRTNPRRAARQAEKEFERHSTLNMNVFKALEEWKEYMRWSDEEMQNWCVSVFKDYWTRKANEKAEYDSRVYLDCPYEQKNKCKKLGGKWDAKKGRWYVSGSADLEPFKEWINE